MVETFMRLADVMRATGLPRSTVYYLASRGEFPKPFKLGPRTVAWTEADIATWQRARLAARDEKAA
jgi:prophage regulatory protein